MHRILRLLSFLGIFVTLAFQVIQAENAPNIGLAFPAVEGRTIQIQVDASARFDSLTICLGDDCVTSQFIQGKQNYVGPLVNEGNTLSADFHQDNQITQTQLTFNAMPAWLSILPPLLAILFAVLLKEVISALFIGIISGVGLHLFYCLPERSLFSGLFVSMSDYILPAVADSGHMSVILFSLLIGGTVAVISRNGGMNGMVNRLARFASNARNAQLTTWALGIVIFFDDYANTLVVGNSMKPITDRFKISREKLAYLVDSTAAPVASIAFVTTWIGAQLGYIQDGVEEIAGLNLSPYSVFISSLPYSFYPIFTLVFMLIIILLKKDFGPMLKAEQLAKTRTVGHHDEGMDEALNALNPHQGTPIRALNAVIPVAILIFGTLLGLWVTGFSADVWNDASLPFFRKLSAIIGAADSYKALLWSSMAALCAAVFLSVIQKILTLEQSMQITLKGFGFMLHACVILCLAWTLSSLTSQLQTADFITESLQRWHANPYWFPVITFILSALVSFSTGSSWSTMAILYPMLLPASWLLCEQQGLGYDESLPLFFHVVNAVLAGSVLGDHCSPISDTTILSSLASGCSHLSHVRTQMPYALTVGSVSIMVGIIPASFGVPLWLLYPIGILILYLIVRYRGSTILEK